ncbi:DUF6923 family protein [Paenibacillus koleovorans]|uniref:DUF6923 family protein n=1 Tax=Paenibacillus koleovorans TaxID=121608 RepID=UPI000FDCB35F|nr:GEVED domain-containing protein [Paenibacillus koleovorans]
MPATITGTVFQDLNHDGQLSPGDPGIANVYVVLFSHAGATCVSTQTNASGIYSFSVTVAGTYSIYETVASPAACPPTVFTQPEGFTMSNGPRKLTVTVTQTQINNNATISNQNFSHDTTDNPFSCNTTMIQFAGAPTVWYNINVVTGATSTQGNLSPPVEVNAIAYNILDNYIYGYDQVNNRIVRVDPNGNLTFLFPLPPGLPVAGYNVGTFDLNGFFYMAVNDASRFYVVDVRPNSATFLKLVNPATGYSEQTSNFGVPLSNTLNVSDWVFRSADSYLYGINPTGTMRRIAPTTGTITNLTTTPMHTGPFGAIAIDASDNIYAISNSSGNIYRYTVSGNTATASLFSNTVTTSFNDATMCPNAFIEVDFGDAPDSAIGNGPNNYSTTLAKNGPRHQLISELMLGTQVTAEEDAYQNPTATGDDLTKGIQDDGLAVPLPILSISAATYSLNVSVTNETGDPANLYGWIDFNENGVFQGNEAAPVRVVASQLGTQTVTLNFTVPAGVMLTPGQTFVRLRLTTDNLVNQNASPTAVDTRSLGAASDGEVEDYILQVNAIADLQVEKTNAPTPVMVGQQLTYTIVVVNNGPDAAQEVVLEDSIPQEVLNPAYSLDGGGTFQPWTGSLELGTFLQGETATILIRGLVSVSATETITNTATVSSSTADPDPSNNTSTSIAPINEAADVAIVKTAIPSPAVAGESLTYSLTVFNGGPSPASNVTLIDSVPSELNAAEYSTNGGVTFQPWTGSLNLGTLADGATQTILIRGIVGAAVTGSITNTAIVNSSTPDPDPDNNTSTTVTPVEESADISVVKTGSPDPAEVGQELTYTITVSNAGPSTADNVTLTDVVPSTLTGVEYSTNGGTSFSPWLGLLGLGTLDVAESVSILLRGTISVSATGSITNQATAISTTPDPDPSNNTSTSIIPLDTSADVSVVKVGAPSPVPAGGLLTFTILVSNAGPADAQNVTLIDTVPSVLSAVEFSTDGGSTFAPWTGSLSLGTIAASNSETVLIRGTVNPSATGIITNTAVVTSTTPDPDPTNNTSTEITPINTSADLSVIKTASPSPVASGGMLTYSVVVANAGPDSALNVTLTDAVPNSLTGVEYSTNGGVTYSPWTGSLGLGTLLSGATQTVLIRGTVDAGASGVISNTATVASETPDPDPSNNSSTVLTPINTSADLSIVKISIPTPVTAGATLTYTIVVSNAGPDTAQNVTLTDAVPGELLNAEFSTDGGVTYSPWTGTLNLGTLADGVSEIVLIRGTVDSSATEEITNTATVGSSTPDPDPDNNTSTVETPIETTADLSIVKLASPDPANPGEQLTYSLVITNNGPSDALDVTVVDAVPSSLTNVQLSTDGGSTFNPWVNPYNAGTISSGDSITLLIRGTVSASAVGSIANTAVVQSSIPDPNLENNESSIETPLEKSADVSVVKLASPNPALLGQLLTYTIVVSNAGPTEAVDVTLTDLIPDQLIEAEYSTDDGDTYRPWTGSINLGTLANGATRLLLVRGVLNPSAVGPITNTASVSSSTPDPDPSNNTSTITTPVGDSADLSIVKTGSPNPTAPGGQVTYTIEVTNDGPDDAENVTITDPVPSQLIEVEFSTDGGVTFNPWTGTVNIGRLEDGESQTVLLRGTVSASATGSIINTAIVTSTTSDPDPNNNTSTTTTPVQVSADISVVKTSSPNPASPGQPLTYMVVVTNEGPNDAENIMLTDIVPSALTEVEYSTDGGVTFSPWTGMLSLGTLGAGASQIVLLRGSVIPSATGTLSNTATVVSTTPDPDPSNNTSTTTTPVQPSADLSIVKTGNPAHPLPGESLTYTIVVTNAGPSSAENVSITDPAPGQLTDVQFSTDGGVTFKPWTGSTSLGTVTVGSSLTIFIRGTVQPSASGDIVNTATVASTTSDPAGTNNRSTFIAHVVDCSRCGKPHFICKKKRKIVKRRGKIVCKTIASCKVIRKCKVVRKTKRTRTCRVVKKRRVVRKRRGI